jgi:hypothetical protein
MTVKGLRVGDRGRWYQAVTTQARRTSGGRRRLVRVQKACPGFERFPVGCRLFKDRSSS